MDRVDPDPVPVLPATVNIIVNGDARQVAVACTLRELLDELGLAEKRVAVELNEAIVPRSEHDRVELAAEDRLEIVHAIGGG